jgi:hypothetical protein
MNDRSHPRLLNCILYDNSDRSGNGESAQIYAETLEVNYCCIQGWSGQWAGAGNMGLNPHFVDADGADGIVGTLDDDLRLAVGSSCIDTGAGSNLIEPVRNDCRGNPRIINGTIDMGAYEFVLGDTDGDDDIDMEDFAAFAAQWLKTQCGACGGADLTDDGDVRVDDLYKLAAGWLAGRNRPAPAWTPETVVINEILTNSTSGNFDWIELYNTSDESINISGWFLSDNSGSLRKFEIADGTWIAPGAYLVFTEDGDFGNLSNPGCHQTFALRAAGEIVCLSSGHRGVLTGYRQKQIFEASENDVSLGRYYKSTGSFDFVALAEQTPGSANAYPKISPVVISEIMYDPQPGAWEDEEEEYIELYNHSDFLVTFTHYPRWKLDYLYLPNYSDPDISLPPHGYLLVVHDLEEFTARFGSMPPDVQVLSYNTPFMNDYTATIKLLMSDILVDSVTYSNGDNPWMFPDGVDPWPAGLIEQGASLTRIFPEKYGNDPNNWQAAAPTPGH